jgi:hypothetical protein
MVATEDEELVETLATNGADKAIGERIGPWRPDRREDEPDALLPEDLVAAGCEHGISVTDQEPDGMSPLGEHHAEVGSQLDHPASIRM